MSWRDVGMHASHARPLRVTVTAFSVSTLSTVTKPIPPKVLVAPAPDDVVRGIHIATVLGQPYLHQIERTYARSAIPSSGPHTVLGQLKT
ncbi:hypothetical protein BHE74_00010929 [Ensete ventricosum]|nr:hypothetical protein BHE74_00010929 [Ensete ventricosum]